MAEHTYSATILWERAPDARFVEGRYSRGHTWQFNGGVTVPASASPLVVPAPFSVANAVDPEEAFVASLSSCHMLFFLFHASKAGFVVERYEDHAVGTMGKNQRGASAIVRVVLRPQITWGGGMKPDAEALDRLHHASHRDCYIASSVTSEVVVEPA